jgi:hypothetical protein
MDDSYYSDDSGDESPPTPPKVMRSMSHRGNPRTYGTSYTDRMHTRHSTSEEPNWKRVAQFMCTRANVTLDRVLGDMRNEGVPY